MNTWRLVIDDALPGAVNMARDAAMLDLYPTLQQPTLRLYGWAPPCVSLGRAQRWSRDVNVDACRALGIDIVRRVTGGRAILHDHELTYAVVIGLDHPLIDHGSVVRSYRALSMALQRGLEALGVGSVFEPEGARRAHAASRASAACFDQPADYEITVAGRKLIGSAQARQHHALLQHGSLLLHADAAQWTRVLRLPPDLDAAALAQRMIGLDEILNRMPAPADVADAVVAGFERACGVRFVPGTLTAAEEARAEILAADMFGAAAWTERR